MSITDWPKRIGEEYELRSISPLLTLLLAGSAAYRSVRICNRPTNEGCKKIPAVKIGQSSLPALPSLASIDVNRGLGMENPGNVE